MATSDPSQRQRALTSPAAKADGATIVGFRLRSGRAVVVLLQSAAAEPIVVDRREILLADPSVPGSAQPYHAALGAHAHAGAKAVARMTAIVERCAHEAVAELIAAASPARLSGAAIVVGSAVDPTTIANDHIRAHAEEGKLFREVVERACGASGLPSRTFVEKGLLAAASGVLGSQPAALKARVARLTRPPGPWRSDEKVAALAAWIVLVTGDW